MAALRIFRTPSKLPISPLSPRPWPGNTAASSAATVEILEDNYKNHHMFFNDRGFHNHITHHILALWFFGAPAPILKEAYKREASYQIKRFESPGKITVENFKDHLGDKQYWKAYLEFFTEVITRDGHKDALEKYIFSSEFNHGSVNKDGQKPEMLSRFLASILHPMIHTGYGYEMDIPGMVIEGLAQTAVHPADCNLFMPASFFDTQVNGIAQQLTSALGLKANGSTPQGLHSFTILAKLLEDSEWKTKIGFEELMEQKRSKLTQLTDQWALDLSQPGELNKKIEEIQWLAVVMYTGAGYREGKDFTADFFLMHLITSSLFLPSLTANISPTSQALLLRSFLVLSFAWWLSAVGRPDINLEGLMRSNTEHPLPPGPFTEPQDWYLPSPNGPLATTPNPWLPIVQRALNHPDEHLPKFQRAVACYAELYGHREAGYFADTGLKGAELLDGTIFVRSAGLTADRLGRPKKGDKPYFWDRVGM